MKRFYRVIHHARFEPVLSSFSSFITFPFEYYEHLYNRWIAKGSRQNITMRLKWAIIDYLPTLRDIILFFKWNRIRVEKKTKFWKVSPIPVALCNLKDVEIESIAYRNTVSILLMIHWNFILNDLALKMPKSLSKTLRGRSERKSSWNIFYAELFYNIHLEHQKPRFRGRRKIT